MGFLQLLHQRAGKAWDTTKQGQQWWDSPPLSAYIKSQICSKHETGVVGAIREAIGGEPLQICVSVGAGTGVKEQAILKAGLADRFVLYEVSPSRAEESLRFARAEGLGDRVESRLGDIFEADLQAEFDLVYWDHALHHMFDVDRALEWSIRALRPGGLLVVNDYVGPTRLQWTGAEIARARAFLAEHHADTGVDPSSLKRPTIVDRWRVMYRDPSEAPQSDQIAAAYRRRTGEDLKLLGGTMIHLCGGFLTSIKDSSHPIFDQLIEWDASARDDGFSHFAFGLWRKPQA